MAVFNPIADVYSVVFRVYSVIDKWIFRYPVRFSVHKISKGRRSSIADLFYEQFICTITVFAKIKDLVPFFLDASRNILDGLAVI